MDGTGTETRADGRPSVCTTTSLSHSNVTPCPLPCPLPLAWDLEPTQPSGSPAPGRAQSRAVARRHWRNWRLSIFNRAARSFTPFRPVDELGLIQSRRIRAALVPLPGCSATAHPCGPGSRTLLSGISVFVCTGSPTPKFHSSHGWGRQVQYPGTGRPIAHVFRFYFEFPLYQTRPD